MSNTLTGLIPVIYKSLNTVSREMVGMIPAVRGNQADINGVTTAAKDQTVRVPIAPQDDLEVIAPGTIKDSGDNTMSYVDIKMDKYYDYPIRYESEEQLSLGSNYADLLAQQFEQGFRSFATAIEEDLGELYKYASRAYGTAGTSPFATSLSGAARARKILDDNGAPKSGRSMVVDTESGASMRELAGLNAQYAAGTDETLRQGTLLPLMGLDIKESSGIQLHTAGTAASATTDNAGYSIEDTTLTLASAGTGTLLAGDVVSIAGDASVQKYVLYSGDADVSGGGTFVLNAPGLRGSLSAATHAITVTGNYTANMAFHRDAIVLASRTPMGGDMAVEEMFITDPLTGLTFRLAKYAQYMRNKLEIQLLWGVKMIKPEHCCVVIG